MVDIKIKDIKDKLIRKLAMIRARQETKHEFAKVSLIDRDNVMIAFGWARTNEGSDFWSDVNNGETPGYNTKSVNKIIDDYEFIYGPLEGESPIEEVVEVIEDDEDTIIDVLDHIGIEYHIK